MTKARDMQKGTLDKATGLTRGQGEKILIVDDELHNLRLLSQTLAKLGYDIESVTSGSLALDKVTAWQPDLILLDIMMPAMNGFEVCEHLKANKDTAMIPIIFVSALEALQNKVKALEIGGVDYITKPIQVREVLARVQTHLTIGALQRKLRAQNMQLEREIQERQQAEIALKQHQDHLEELVVERTTALQQEITERERAEVNLHQLSRAVEQSPVVVIITDAQGNIEYVNPKFTQLTGYSAENVVGKNPRLLKSGETPPDVYRQLWETILAGQEWRGEFHNRKKDGTLYWGQASISPIRDSQGMITHFVAIQEDITERKQMAAALQDYADHLEQLVADKVHELEVARAKAIQTARLASLGEMATGVAHEVNQPLTAMLFDADYLKLMAEKILQGDSEAAIIDAETVYQISENLIADIARARRITDYLRAFNQISKGEVVEVNLNEPFEDSFVLTEARLKQSGISVRRNLRPDLPWLWANPYKLEQVFLNLLSNAEHALNDMAHYIAAGEVVRADYHKILEIATFVEDNNVVATIHDNGCGIPEDIQPHIFDPFFTTRPDEAAGLGLTICRSIMIEFQGEIDFESVVNNGTTFRLRFPIN